LDDSLLSVLPAVVRKPKEARSEFEQASFQNVVTMFGKEVEKLAAEIAEGQAGKAARAEAAASAQAVLDEAGQKKIAAETALEEAKTAEKVGAVALRNAEKNVASWLGDSKRTLDSYDEAEAAKADFASVLATFEKLKELEPPPPEPEAAAEEPVAEPPIIVHTPYGWRFIFFVFFVFGTYLTLGIAYNVKRNGATGMDAMPHIEMWKDLPFLVRDGIFFSIDTIKSKGKAQYQSYL